MGGEVVDRGEQTQAFLSLLTLIFPARRFDPDVLLGMLLSPLRAALRPSTSAAALRTSFPTAISFRALASASPSADQSSTTRQTTSIPPPSMEDSIRTKVAGLDARCCCIQELTCPVSSP